MLFTASPRLCALTATGALAFFAADLEGRDEAQAVTETSARFAAPVRLMAGDAYLGEKRMYPSPAMYDWNGDGRMDVVIGDLPGRVTVALRTEDGSLAAEAKAKTSAGESLDFGNW